MNYKLNDSYHSVRFVMYKNKKAAITNSFDGFNIKL